MTSPFQSILQQQPESSGPVNQDNMQDPGESTIADFLADLMSRASATANSEGKFSGESDPAKPSSAPPPKPRPPLQGGVLSEADAIDVLNAHYFIGKSKQETAIFRINGDGSVAFVPNEQFKLEVQNIFVQGRGSARPGPVEKFWKESPHRRERKLVFKPGGTTGPDEFNLAGL